MIAHSNILNEIFRGKFSHNRDHCPPPPSSPRPNMREAALVMGKAQGQDAMGVHGFPGCFGAEHGAGEAAWLVWRESSSARKKREEAVPTRRQRYPCL